jgi:hypothetical protein
VHRLGQVVVAAQVTTPEQLRAFCTRNISPKLTISPRASNTSRLGLVRVSRRKASRWITRPRPISSAKLTGIISSGDRPQPDCAAQVMKAPSIRNSPCAMFSTRISPYCRFSPSAMSA